MAYTKFFPLVLFALGSLVSDLAAQRIQDRPDPAGSGGLQGPTGGDWSVGGATGAPGSVVASFRYDRDALGGLTLVNPFDGFGFAAAPLGDLDGDGNADVAVGSPFYNAFNDGAVWILFLEANGSVRDARRLRTPNPGLAGGNFGHSIAALGDLNGDGTCDLAVGEPGIGAGGIGGAFWVLFLNPDGSVQSSRLTRGETFVGAVGPLEGFGDALGAIGDLDGDGVVDLAVGSPSGDFGEPNFGHIWITFLNSNGSAREAIKVGPGVGGLTAPLEERGHFGTALAGIGDLDGDGVLDLAVGAPGRENDGFINGHLWILFLNADGTVKAHRDVTELTPGRFGSAIAALGDDDGDGVPDLAVSAQAQNLVHILHLNSDGTVKNTIEFGDGLGGFDGSIVSTDDFGGSLVAVGDLDGNGTRDLLVGAENDDVGGNNSGALWVVSFAGDAVSDERRIANEQSGPITNSEFGGSLAQLGDLSGDGIPELLMSAPNDESNGNLGARGSVWVIFPDADGSVLGFQKIGPSSGGYSSDLGFTHDFGSGIASLGDMDGDGLDEIAVGIPHRGFTRNGRVAILALNADGTVRAQQEISDGQAGFTGFLEDKDNFGHSVANIGDLNGDGVVDLAVGAPGSVPDDVAPAVWILFLNSDGTVQSHRRIAAGEGGGPADIEADSNFGTALSSMGDFDGDGFDELAVGLLEDGAGGGVWLLSLAANGLVTNTRRINSTTGGFTGELDGNFGASVATLGDLDGNGVGDLAVGAPRTDTNPGNINFQGRTWILFLNADGTVSTHRRIDQTTDPFLGLQHNSFFGSSLALLGDANADGVRDLFVGVSGPGPSVQDVGYAWALSLGGVAHVDFETRGDLVTPLVNGEAIEGPFHYGGGIAIEGLSASGFSAAAFDSTPNGPNAGGPDPDLLVDRGHLLIVQRSGQESEPGIYATPDDDRAGGTVQIDFDGREVAPLSIDLVDLCPLAGQDAFVTLTDASGLVRLYHVPAGWTGDVSVDGPPGYGTLLLTTLDPQPGLFATASAQEDALFDQEAVVSIEVLFLSSGALDALVYDPYPAR